MPSATASRVMVPAVVPVWNELLVALPGNTACVELAGIVKLTVLPPPSNWIAGSSIEPANVRFIRPETGTGSGATILKLKRGCWRESTVADRPLMLTPGAKTEKFWALEVPPPGDGVKTVTAVTAGVAISVAAIEATSSVLLRNVVVRGEPFQRTSEVVAKPVPITDRVKAGPPAGIDDGLRRVTVGGAFPTTIDNVTGFEVPPPGAGLKTVTLADPIAAISPAGIAAAS